MQEKNIHIPLTNDKERDLIKRTFKDNEVLLKVLRKLLLGYNLTDQEKELIKKTFTSSELKEVVRKKFYPVTDLDAPIGGMSDFWLGVEENIIGRPPETIMQSVESKRLVYEMYQKAFALLDNPDGEKVSIEYNPKLVVNDPFQVGLIARNLYFRAINMGLVYLKVIAEQETEVSKEAKKNAKKDDTH